MYALLTVKTPPSPEPVSVADAAAHLRLDQADPILDGLIAAARQKIESLTQVALATTEYIWTMTEQPPVSGNAIWITIPPAFRLAAPRIELPRYPVQSVASVVTITEAGDESTLVEGDDYSLDTSLGPARLRLTTMPWQMTVNFTAGYETDTLPPIMPLMVKMLVAHLYEHRGDDDAPELPKALDLLLADYRVPVW